MLGAKSCSSLEFSFELLLFLVPSQLTSDSKGRCITKCLPKTKKKKSVQQIASNSFSA